MKKLIVCLMPVLFTHIAFATCLEAYNKKEAQLKMDRQSRCKKAIPSFFGIHSDRLVSKLRTSSLEQAFYVINWAHMKPELKEDIVDPQDSTYYIWGRGFLWDEIESRAKKVRVAERENYIKSIQSVSDERQRRKLVRQWEVNSWSLMVERAASEIKKEVLKASENEEFCPRDGEVANLRQIVRHLKL